MATTTKPQRGSRARRLALPGGPTTRPMSGKRWFPLYGVLHHVGRTSARQYATPVVVRATEGATYVPLPFGEGTDWYRNALAAGAVRTTWKGRDHWLAEPNVVPRTLANDGFNPIMRSLMRAAGIEMVVRFDPMVELAQG